MFAAYLWVAVGGAVGSVLRFGISEWMALRLGSAFPWGTLGVNVVGSLVIGALAAMAAPDGVRYLSETSGRALLMVGLCGGFTTFSSFSLQTLALVQEGHLLAAGANVVGSVGLCLGAVWIGFTLGGLIFSKP